MNGLEALDRIKKFLKAKNKLIYNTKGVAQIEKELKALEIIKNKRVWVNRFLFTDSVEEHNKIYNEKFWLTKDEYDLLKEVLK